jgi:hypothetical protein
VGTSFPVVICFTLEPQKEVSRIDVHHISRNCYAHLPPPPQHSIELGYNAMKGTEIFCVVITEECNVMVNSEELIGTTKYLTL